MEDAPESADAVFGVPAWASLDDEDTMSDLDTVRGSHGPLSSTTRARLYAAIAEPGWQTWADARLIVVDYATQTSLWLAVVRWSSFAGGLMDRVAPTAAQVRSGLRGAATHIRARAAYERAARTSEPALFEALPERERDTWYRHARRSS